MPRRAVAVAVSLAVALAGTAGTADAHRRHRPRTVDLERYGRHPNGNPVVFVRRDGGLVVDCDHPAVWCDDEGA